MTNCKYCHNAVLNFQQINGEGDHTKCGREYVRRQNMGSCVFCDGSKVTGDNIGCNNCLDYNLDYEGYEGPGQ